MSGIGIRGPGLLPISRLGGVPAPFVYSFDLGDVVFTPGMAKRTGSAGVFDGAPIVQGKWDGTGTPDVVSFSRGSQLANLTGYWYANFDPYQADIVWWMTPEWAGNDGIEHNIAYWSSNYRIYKSTGNALVAVIGGQTFTGPSTAAWTAGTSYGLDFAFDTKNTIDGTDYARWSVNNAQTYGVTTQPTVSAADATAYIGSTSTPTLAADANVEGFAVYRRVLYDQNGFGTPPLDGTDELTAIYAAAAGLDSAQVCGSWDCVLHVPTDSTPGALVTGTGEAWSHPHGSSIPDVSFASDGGLPGSPFAVEFNGSSTSVNCGSNAAIDNIPSAAQMTVGAWVRLDGDPSTAYAVVVAKGEIGVRGWALYYDKATNTFKAQFGTNTAAQSETFTPDGKWHYIAGYLDDAANTGRCSLDGRWGAAQAMAAAYVSDAADSLYWGRSSASATYYQDGATAWVELSNNDRHTAGTDFVPPRTPYDDGNTVESWHASEGTGVTAAATVTSPANDGTIANGSWSAIWEVESTPVIPQSVDRLTTTGRIDYGSGANIDDLPDFAVAGKGQITVEGWFLFPGTAGNFTYKGAGWIMSTLGGGGVRVTVYCAGGNSQVDSTTVVDDNKWHHIAFTYDETGDRKTRVFIDGILEGVASSASAGNYSSDAASTLRHQYNSVCKTGWLRVSDNIRYTATFVPPDRANCPANDANAQLLIPMTDGAGTTCTDGSGNGYNGTISGTRGTDWEWHNTPDMEVESPGERTYPWGYAVGSDGAGDGITIIDAAEVTAETDYVIKATVSWGMSGRAQPYVYIYDNIGAAQIGANFVGPLMTGQHTGANNAATLTDANARWVYVFDGWKLYNITDGSSTTVTANTETTQTGVLAGGTDNDWDTNDVYLLRPPSSRTYSQHPWQETFVFRTPAGCTSIDVKVLNAAGEGVMHVHQVEVYESLLDNGDHEDLDGGFPAAAELITGWTNSGLDAGDTEPEAVVIHAGAQSLEWNTGAAADEGQYNPGFIGTADKFYGIGCWFYNDGSSQITWGAKGFSRGALHNDASVAAITPPTTARWLEGVAVIRAEISELRPELKAQSGAVGDRFTDDVYMIELDDVSLTITPASSANSLEGTGIRVDGLDSATVAAAIHHVLATAGGIRFRATPRHSIANSEAFGQTEEYLLDLTEDANNYLRVYRDNAGGGTLTLAVNQNGAGPWTDTDTPAWAADTEALIDVYNFGGAIQVWFDGVPLLEVGGLTGFAAHFTQPAYFGSDDAPDLEGDVVISPP